MERSRSLKTVHFICSEKWECPLCGEMTQISRIKCKECKRDMGISKFSFEARLKRAMPSDDYDHHKIGSGEETEYTNTVKMGGEQAETLF